MGACIHAFALPSTTGRSPESKVITYLASHRGAQPSTFALPPLECPTKLSWPHPINGAMAVFVVAPWSDDRKLQDSCVQEPAGPEPISSLIESGPIVKLIPNDGNSLL